MKKFLVDYAPSLGAFLDDENITWETLVRGNNEYIVIHCHDAADLFRIALSYSKWYAKLPA